MHFEVSISRLACVSLAACVSLCVCVYVLACVCDKRGEPHAALHLIDVA